MDTLGYTHMAMAYEDTYGPLGIRSFAPPRPLRWRRATGVVAIASLILIGGLTAIVGSALSPSNTAPQHQAPGF